MVHSLSVVVSWLITVVLIQSLLLSCVVVADEPIDSICHSSSEYLDAMYRCRPGDFQVLTFCTVSSPYELSCNRSKRIAVHSATIGPAQSNQCNNPPTVVSASSSGHTGTTDGECCLLPAVEVKCRGKMKCIISSDLQLQSVDNGLCPPSSPPLSSSSYSSSSSSSRRQQRSPLSITVAFICVSQRTLKDINRDKSSPDAFCEGQSESTLDDAVPLPATDNQLLHQPADIFQINGQAATTSSTQRLDSTHSAGLTSSGVNEPSPSDVVPPVTHRRTGTVDWIWSFVFIKENLDRFLIYLFLSVAVGVICVLLVVILGLCFSHRLRHRKQQRSSDTGGDDVIHRKQSSTQTTTDVTSNVIASNRSPGVEMVRYVPTNSSLRYQPLQARTPPTPVGAGTQSQHAGPPSAAGPGNMVHFATDGSSTEGLASTDSFTGNGGFRGGHGLDLQLYQMSSTSRDSVDGDGGGGVAGEAVGERGGEGSSDDYRSSTLGRFYSNPYRHDSYRSDGFRTLQHK